MQEAILSSGTRAMTSRTRATLLEQLRDGGDPLAWDEFFHRYWPTIYAFARRRGCSEHTAEEIVQEVMLKVFSQRDVFHYDPQRGRFRDWLGTVTGHQLAEYRRRPAQRIRPAGGENQCGMLELPASEPAPDELWNEAFERSLLGALLDVLRAESNPRDYLAFELVALDQLKAADVARVTGVSRNAVYKIHRKLLQRLRQLAGGYASLGTLRQQVKTAVQERPPAHVQRSVSQRVSASIQSGERDEANWPG